MLGASHSREFVQLQEHREQKYESKSAAPLADLPYFTRKPDAKQPLSPWLIQVSPIFGPIMLGKTYMH